MNSPRVMLRKAVLVAVIVVLVVFPPVALGMEFREFDTFRPYETPQLQPFNSPPQFEEKPMDPYKPGPEPPDVTMPEYKERPYGEIQPPEEPEVQVNTGPFQQYRTYRPMAPIKEGPMRPMKGFGFQEFKPLGKEQD